MAQAVIMAGGQGERFWPSTHAKFPKYRIRFDGKRSLLRGTYDRLVKIFGAGNIHVVTTEEHAPLIREELPELPKANIQIEPFRNNTAAAIYLSVSLLKARYGTEETISFFPADHLIQNEALFAKTVRGTIELAARERLLVTVGIKPTFPATGYGYIQSGKPVKGAAGAFYVSRFVEKPDKKKATTYLAKKNFYWNAGIFTWRAGVFLEAMKRFSSDFERHFDLADLAGSYRKLPNLSIDYALLEKADNIAVFRTTMDWCDMGHWDMLWEKSPKDADKNFKPGKILSKDCRRSVLVNESALPVVAVGCEDLVIVQTERGTLICPRGRAEEATLFFKKSRA